MPYLVFDLDETLAELYSTFYFLISLTPEPPETRTPSDVEFKSKLDVAYKLFVKKVLSAETSHTEPPLGVLRPGILQVFEKIQQLKNKGHVKGVMIYSNNGHLESLEFIRDLIHEHLGTNDLILECIHREHHMRNEERAGSDGYPNKTWNVLSTILKNPPVEAPADLSPEAVYFFDDQLHTDLKMHLKKNYIRVPPYTFKASFDILAQQFTSALDDANIDKDDFRTMISQLLGRPLNSYNNVLAYFKKKTKDTSHGSPPTTNHDEGIQQMNDTLREISTPLKTGGRKRKQRPWNGKTKKQRRYINKRRHTIKK
jgi:FMN phosphatase YigB (HAD superfamily)